MQDVRPSVEPMPAEATEPVFPEGLHNAYLFAVFNALSFQVVLNSPMVLYAKSLGASATVLGLMSGLMPLLVIFQIPAAYYLPAVGFKRFMLYGWTLRVAFIFFMATVPLTTGFLDNTSRLGLLLALLFGFNLARGISSAAWWPWMTALVPHPVRGRYLARDAACINLASFAGYLLSAACLGRNPGPWHFSLLFLFSAVMGAVSLVFLKRIPDVPPAEPAAPRPRAVALRSMLGQRPFRRLLCMVVAWALAYGGLLTFTVAFLRAQVGLPEGDILLVTSIAFLGGLSSLWFLGSRLDTLGSKPVLTFAFVVWLGLMTGWTLLAGGLWPPRLWILGVLEFLMGLSAALVMMSNTRLAMVVIPAEGRSYFFAFYSVATFVTLGVSPILWGLLIDAIGPRQFVLWGFPWSAYSIFFAAVGMTFLAALILTRRLEEPEAAGMEDLLKEILIQTPQRLWLRLFSRA